MDEGTGSAFVGGPTAPTPCAAFTPEAGLVPLRDPRPRWNFAAALVDLDGTLVSFTDDVQKAARSVAAQRLAVHGSRFGCDASAHLLERSEPESAPRDRPR